MRWRYGLLLALWAGDVPNNFAQLCSPAITWQRAVRDAGVSSIQPTSDGGYILSGTSYPGSDAEQTSPNYGNGDVYLVRLDSNLTRVWDSAFGGTDWDGAFHVVELTDGFIVAGDSSSGPSGNKTSLNFGGADFWLIRTDTAGNKLWERSFGGTNYDSASCLQKTADGGFIIGGVSGSGINGNKTTPNYGDLDYWVIRTDSAGKGSGSVHSEVLHATLFRRLNKHLTAGSFWPEHRNRIRAETKPPRTMAAVIIGSFGLTPMEMNFGKTVSAETATTSWCRSDNPPQASLSWAVPIRCHPELKQARLVAITIIGLSLLIRTEMGSGTKQRGAAVTRRPKACFHCPTVAG